MKLNFSILLATAMLCLVSCKKGNENAAQLDTKKNRSEISLFGKPYRIFNLSKNERKISLPAGRIAAATNNYQAIQYETMEMDTDEFQQFLGNLQQRISGDILTIDILNTKTISIFIAGANTDDCSLMKGMSLISNRSDRYFQHRFLSVNGLTSSENQNYAAKCTYLTSTDLDALLRSSISPDECASPTLLTIETKNENSTTGLERMGLGSTLINANAAYMPVGAGSNGCVLCGDVGSGCLYQNGGPESAGGTYDCQGGSVCIAARMPDFSGDMNKAYSFRDNFLMLHAKGQKYTDYYYYLSYIFSELKLSEPISLADQFSFAEASLGVADILQSGDNSQLVITPEYKKQADNMINHYRKLTPNTYYQQVLDDISNDMNRYLNQSKAQVLTSLD